MSEARPAPEARRATTLAAHETLVASTILLTSVTLPVRRGLTSKSSLYVASLAISLYGQEVLLINLFRYLPISVTQLDHTFLLLHDSCKIIRMQFPVAVLEKIAEWPPDKVFTFRDANIWLHFLLLEPARHDLAHCHLQARNELLVCSLLFSLCVLVCIAGSLIACRAAACIADSLIACRAAACIAGSLE
jgi:hypothetical protein